MLDNTDKQIIKELSKNSRISMRALGAKIHLSGVAAKARIEKLEDINLIQGYTIKLNEKLLGCQVHAMINITVKDNFHRYYIEFIAKQTYHIIHNYRITGNSCYLLECRFPSQEELDGFLDDLNHYANYQVNIILKDTIAEPKDY